MVWFGVSKCVWVLDEDDEDDEDKDEADLESSQAAASILMPASFTSCNRSKHRLRLYQAMSLFVHEFPSHVHLNLTLGAVLSVLSVHSSPAFANVLRVSLSMPGCWWSPSTLLEDHLQSGGIKKENFLSQI